MSDVRIGCSGWNYDHWREVFYPRGLPTSRWLQRYAEEFDTVEVNATFYRLPTRKTVARWAAETPDGFLFAVKASRYLTHVKRLRLLAGDRGGSLLLGAGYAQHGGRGTVDPPGGADQRQA